MKKKKTENKRMLSPLMSNVPFIEFISNREVTLEGSMGVLEYSSELIRVNTEAFVVAFFGRKLDLKCISDSAIIIEGFITKVEFNS